MPKTSAGILLYRFKNNILELLLTHHGGPFWVNKDLGAWSIPKGEFEPDELALNAAKRELQEETGIIITGPFIELTPIKQNAGKTIYAWAMEFDFDTTTIKSNSFDMEWPPKSGNLKSFPEVDRADWFNVDDAKLKIIKGQIPLIIELEKFIINL